jgi:hypothetical protein
LGVFEVGNRGAVFGAIVFIPIFHEEAFHLKALLQQQMCGNG